MSAMCVCKRPVVEGVGEQEHCTRCGAWTYAAIEANYERKRVEKAVTAANPHEDETDAR